MTYRHHHHHKNEKGCCHGEESQCHQEESHECCCPCHEQHHHDHDSCNDFSKELLELADEAWMELLKEKIKAKIEASSAGNLDKLAQLVTETNHTRWQMILAKKKGCNDYKEKLQEFFNHKCESNKK